MPLVLGNLTSLTTLNLAKNSLNGSYPFALNKLTNLELLSLDGNNIKYYYEKYYIPADAISNNKERVQGYLTDLRELEEDTKILVAMAESFGKNKGWLRNGNGDYIPRWRGMKSRV